RLRDSSLSFLRCSLDPRHLPSSPTRRSSDLAGPARSAGPAQAAGPARAAAQAAGPARAAAQAAGPARAAAQAAGPARAAAPAPRSEEHTSELQSRENLVCRLLLEKKKKQEDR